MLKNESNGGIRWKRELMNPMGTSPSPSFFPFLSLSLLFLWFPTRTFAYQKRSAIYNHGTKMYSGLRLSNAGSNAGPFMSFPPLERKRAHIWPEWINNLIPRSAGCGFCFPGTILPDAKRGCRFWARIKRNPSNATTLVTGIDDRWWEIKPQQPANQSANGY